jgi:hypothetical protein
LFARRYGQSPSLLFRWKRRMFEGGHEVVQADEEVVGTSKVRELERRVRDQRPLGRAARGRVSAPGERADQGRGDRVPDGAGGWLKTYRLLDGAAETGPDDVKRRAVPSYANVQLRCLSQLNLLSGTASPSNMVHHQSKNPVSSSLR